MSNPASLSARRVLATDIRVGDRIALIGTLYFTVEWVRVWEDGGVSMAGVRSNGQPHTNSVSSGALVSRVFQVY